MSGQLLCVIPGPSVEMKREPAGVLWCFGCRAHLAHDWVLMGDPFPSYYDPSWSRRCSRCSRDLTVFPGTEVWYGGEL